MPRWRCRIMWVTRICTRFITGYEGKGKPARRDTAPIVVSNHVSFIEPIFFFYELSPTIVASESHDSLPFVGTIIRAMQVIYVNRFSQESRKNAVHEIKGCKYREKPPPIDFLACCSSLKEPPPTGKFFISFQLGAFIPGYPIQPVVVRYPHVHFDQSWGNISLLLLMFRMFTQFHNFMEVEYLPVIYPSDTQKQNAVRLSQRKTPQITWLKWPRCASLFNISSLEAVRYLDTFSSMNPDSSGRVTLHDFLRVLKLKPCTLSKGIFGFIDVEKAGSITFRQFLFASAHVSAQPLFQQTCELAFSHCDADGDGFISVQELGDVLKHNNAKLEQGRGSRDVHSARRRQRPKNQQG
ncbi:Lysophospholipid acyltransferase LPEAT2 [Raphanus sativus]|nr:Lysophospholipid acyltransferase LPEAT2 [Raphanus sativus]